MHTLPHQLRDDLAYRLVRIDHADGFVDAGDIGDRLVRELVGRGLVEIVNGYACLTDRGRDMLEVG